MDPRRHQNRTHDEEGASLPPGYRLDEGGADILILRRWDESEAACFTTWGLTRDELEEVARKDLEGRG